MEVECVGQARGRITHPDLALGDLARIVLEVDAGRRRHGGPGGPFELWETEIPVHGSAVRRHLLRTCELVVRKPGGGV
jgi:hypothetical protein